MAMWILSSHGCQEVRTTYGVSVGPADEGLSLRRSKALVLVMSSIVRSDVSGNVRLIHLRVVIKHMGGWSTAMCYPDHDSHINAMVSSNAISRPERVIMTSRVSADG